MAYLPCSRLSIEPKTHKGRKMFTQKKSKTVTEGLQGFLKTMIIPLLKKIIQNVTPQQTNVHIHQRQSVHSLCTLCALSLSPLLLLRYQSFHKIHFLCLLVLISLAPLYIKANKNKILTTITTCCCFETDCQIV